MFQKIILSGLLGLSVVPGARAATFGTVSAPPIDNLTSIWGMNVRLEYTDGHYNGTSPVNNQPDVRNDIADLLYLGSNGPAFRSVRDVLPNSNAGTGMGAVYGQQLSAIQQFVHSGIGFTFLTGNTQGADTPNQTVAQTLTQLELTASYAPPSANQNPSQPPPSLKFVEGPNEVDSNYSFAGKSGNAAGIAWGQQLYQAKNASPLVHVYMTDFTTQANPGTCVIGYYADEANNHAYPNNGTPPGGMLASDFAASYGNVPAHCPYGLPKAVTEDGYPSPDDANPNNYGSNRGDINRREVSQGAQMEYLLDLGMDAYAQGLREIDFYQLLAAYTDPNGTNEDTEFGWFNYDGSPKPVAQAYHALTGLLIDGSAYDTTPRSLTYALDNPPSGGGSQVFSTYDGSRYFVVVWGEYDIFNPATSTQQDPPGVGTTLTLPAPASSITLYDPTRFASTQQASCSHCASLFGTFGSHPEVFVIKP